MGNDLSYYMSAYMFDLEQILNDKSNELNNIRFQFDEANTDEELKSFIKKVVLNECRIIKTIESVEICDRMINIDSSKFYIIDCLTPSEYDNESKESVKNNKPNSIYVKPDLILKINFEGRIVHESIELKSTKSDKIPGSSIQQISADEWVIFVKHSNSKIEVITGQYKNSINCKIPFPDRSPRPQISYNELRKWTSTYRISLAKTLTIKSDEDEQIRTGILDDWQEILATRWLEVIKGDALIKKEPWFNNNLRKFVIDLLIYYDSLNEKEKQLFKNRIKKNIKGE